MVVKACWISYYCRKNILHVYIFKGAGVGISEHYLLVTKIRCLRKWSGRIGKTEVNKLKKVMAILNFNIKIN